MRKLLFFYTFFLCAEQPIVMVVGTRPEAIKMAPVYYALKKEGLPVLLCSTGQHNEMLNEVLDLFAIEPDVEFEIMKPGQDLFHINTTVLEMSKELFLNVHPRLVMVQGDTTTAMAAAMAAFYLHIPVAHVEAGLRSGNRQRPFPEEINREIISLVATYHFAPTARAMAQLLREGVDREKIYCTGNTVVDALYSIIEQKLEPSEQVRSFIEKGQKTLLLTAHRRESFDSGLFHIFMAMKKAHDKYPNLSIIYPVHPNPAIRKVLDEVHLDECERITLVPPVVYKDLVYLLNHVDGVATDSGGIQEEAVSLNKPVIVLREETDRPEAIEEGFGFLVGTCEDRILKGIDQIMANPEAFAKSSVSVYGDGRAAARIARILKNE
jgi:UDP-N-acetylglucosamine 2-epimerase (non-hydrolysing)